MKRTFSLVLALLFCSAVFAQSDDPQTGAHLASQAAADVIRQAAGADGAFLAAGQLNSTYDKKNLASLVQFPTDKIVVVNLKGAEIKQALERSVSLYPQPNSSFLQLSGFSVDFKGSGAEGTRTVSISADGSSLDMNHTYAVAMPNGLAMGALGYFKIWDKSRIAKKLDVTLEQALSGKPYVQTSPRWVLR